MHAFLRKLSALAFILLVSQTAQAAPIVWSIQAGGNGHSYDAILKTDGITWQQAEAEAISMGGHLATITSADENDFVHSLIATNPAFWVNVGVDTRGPWLGAFQQPGSPEPNSGWTWVTGEPFDYTNWGTSANGPTQPQDNPSGEDWLHFFGGGNSNFADTWNDLHADGNPPNAAPRGYIVEFVPEPGSASILLMISLMMLRIKRYRR
ncbi:MAG: hypothetical protein MI923_16160 [Phycisphaerales bacterium]|nr:hypothetical protein [Phycisphaerales bacterium]